jgi:hypothetical protein
MFTLVSYLLVGSYWIKILSVHIRVTYTSTLESQYTFAYKAYVHIGFTYTFTLHT